MGKTCVDCGADVHAGHRCFDCLAEVTETPNWHPGPRRQCVSCDRQVPPGRRKYCSQQCASITNSRAWRSGRRPVRRLCVQCGAVLFDRQRKRYCSQQCRDINHGRMCTRPARRCALPECGKEFQPTHEPQRCCCEQHGKRLCNREARAFGRKWLGDPDARRSRLRRRTQFRRAVSRGVEADQIDRDAVGRRDGWRCGVCRRKIRQTLAYPHPMSPSLDHVIPLSEGGPHTYANVRITHLKCNNDRSNRGGGEQLALIG